VATSRELTYVEEKGQACDAYSHRRNHTITADRGIASVAQVASLAVKVS
jgi:hypothetical protein